MVKSKSLVAKVLEIFGQGTVTAIDVITTILESGYGASYYELNKNLRKIEGERLYRELEYKERQRFSNLISKLKQEGLIEGDRTGWKITRVGQEKLNKIQEVKNRKVSLSPFAYENKTSKEFTLVIFDIPEECKEKRNWLREVLIVLGFKLLQKSVWIGKTVIPENFLKDLKRLKIFQHIHVFSVFKSGTIRADD